MNLFEQFRRAEEAISKDGAGLGSGLPFTLFGLFERDDVPNKFDVVVSAYWLGSGDLTSLTLIAELVRRAIGNDNWWPRIGKFVILAESDPFVRAVLSQMPESGVRHDLKVLNDLPYDGDIIRNAVIITAQKDLIETPAAQLVAA